jgi:hypothetical protein
VNDQTEVRVREREVAASDPGRPEPTEATTLAPAPIPDPVTAPDPDDEDTPPAMPSLPEPTEGAAPEWAHLPKDLRWPKGRQVLFVRFRAEMTDTRWKGERQAILWPISMGDKKLALGRAGGDPNRLSDELTKCMVRAIDGHVVDTTGVPGPANLDAWWDEIGEKCRSMLSRIFVQLHVVSRDEAADFFESCVAVRITG